MTRHPGAPLRVLLVTGAYFPEFNSGGLQTQMVARHLDGTVRFAVMTTAVDPALKRRDTVDGVAVTRIRVDVRSRTSKAIASVAMVAELVRILPRVDVVHIHGVSDKNILVGAVAKAYGRAVVLSLHTAGHDEPGAIAAHGALARRAFRSADLYLAVSPRLVDAYLDAGFPPGKIRLVPNGIDLERFHPASPAERVEARRRLGLLVDRPLVLFVGFFSRDKQPDVLLRAWLDLQSVHGLASTLVCVGATRSAYFEVDERLAVGMREDALRAGVSDRLIFVEPTHDIAEYFRAADVFALPSSREGHPLALLEAMATGLPCVASRLPGATDTIVQDGVNGWLVQPGDAASLASAIATALKSPECADRLAGNARATVEARYAGGRTAEAWLDAYTTVLKKTA